MRKLIIKREYLIVASFLGVHLLLGVGSALSSVIAKACGAIPILLGTYYIIKSRNRNNEAVYWTAYYAALEVLLRVTGGTVGYEMAKYVAIFFLILGEFLNPGSNKKKIWILFCLLLLPGLLLTDYSTDNIGEIIRASLAGPVLLAVGAYYFSGREINWEDYKKILRYIVLPLFSLGIALIIKTPDLSSINFRAASNFATSGGFGPVHVSSVLGIGILILLVGGILKQNILGNKWIDLVVWALLLYRALLTFSRSGIYTAIAVSAIIVISLLNDRDVRRLLRKYALLGFATIVLLIGIWNKVNTVTKGMAYNRFTGRNTAGVKAEDITTNRVLLLTQEFEIFLDHPFAGIGVGMTSEVREERFSIKSSSHTEYSRLLAEHGLFGVMMLLIVLTNSLRHFLSTSGVTRLFFVFFACYSLIVMFPASTRTALPLFAFGLAFVRINNNTEE